MNFLQRQHENITQNDQQFTDDFQSSSSCIPRRVFLYNCLQYLFHVKDEIKKSQEASKQLSIQQLKAIRPQDTSSYVFSKISERYQVMLEEKEPDQQLDEDDVFGLVVKTFKWELFAIMMIIVVGMLCRISFSIVILYLFQAVEVSDWTKAYIYSGVLMLLWYFYMLMYQTADYLCYVLASNIKGALAMMLYTKTSKLTSYVLKSASLGKITNLISNDLTIIEMRLISLLQAIAFPVTIIGVTTLLYTRIGWIGFVGVTVLLLQIPLANRISKKNGEVLKDVNKNKDKRVQLTTQTIEGIKYVKLYGWEMAFKRIIQDIREKQISHLKTFCLGKAFERALAHTISLLGPLVMFLMAVQLNGTLTVPIIFSILEIMTTLKRNLLLVNMGTGLYYQLKVVFGRFASVFNIENKSMIEIDETLKTPVRKDESLSDSILIKSSSRIDIIPIRSKRSSKGSFNNATKNDDECQPIIEFSQFNGYWKEEFKVPALKNINFVFNTGKIYGITGKVGSGKSGLIGAMLRQIPYYSGSLVMEGKIAYVEQEPIVFSDTVYKNILFGRPFSFAKYQKAVELSCLKNDFKLLAEGDMTIVGEKGVTLSGGQKARLALARAIYGQADIYLFDDPISAVDARVAKKLFQNCIKPLAKDKIVILVTHQINYIEECDEAIVMDNGQISASGVPSQIKNALKELSEKEQKKEEEEQEDSDDENKDGKQKPKGKMHNMNKFHSLAFDIEAHNKTFFIEESSTKSEIQLVEKKGEKNSEEEEIKKEQLKKKFFEKEADVTLTTYKDFFWSTSINYLLIPLTLLLFFMSEGIITIFYRIVADFGNVQEGTSSMFGGNFTLYWSILGGLVVLFFIALVIKYYCLAVTLLNASEANHLNMIQSIVRCPGKFFDTTPSGTLVNKFSNDIGIIDNVLFFGMIDALEGPVLIIVAIVNVCQINIYFLIAAAIICFIAVIFFKYARPAIIACKQLDLQKKSPIFQFYSETISGLTQIKVYAQRKAKLQQFSEIINTSSKAIIGFDVVSRGFGFYQTIISIFLMFAGMIMGIALVTNSGSGLYGVAVVYLVTISQFLQRILRQIILVESLMVSAERLLQFRLFDSEKELRTPYDFAVGLKDEVQGAQKGENVHQEWPDVPSIEFKNFSAKYDENLPLTLKGLNFSIESNEKVGIVGRTGAGKSSIIQALFRIFEPETGSTFKIDGYNALDMGLHSLRQHISVIPQVPFLFKGTVRQNIDPFETSSDERLWEVLEESGLSQHVKKMENGLDANVSNISESFSVGQRQLLCLARALLKRNKFLVLDEATSNVDMQTDAFIQKVIKQKFADTTVITIAHRLNTIADYDKVIVMKRGKIVEQGAPWQLLQKQGQFYQMARHTGKNAEVIKNKALEQYQKKINLNGI